MLKREPGIVRNAEDEAVRALPWMRLGESFPVPPTPGALLRSAAGRVDSLARTQRHRRAVLRLVYGLAVALMLALGGGGIYLGYRALAGGQDSTAWACSEGYMVRVQVFEPASAGDAKSDAPPPVMGQVEQAALEWAKQNRMDTFAQGYTEPNNGIDPSSHRYLAYDPSAAMSSRSEPQLNHMNYLLAGVSLQESQALRATLALLPGVLESKCLAYDLYRNMELPDEICIGRKIIINGKALRFPQDFSRAQAGTIGYYYSYFKYRHIDTLYCAFRKLNRSPDAPADPLGVGDAFKVELDADGRLVFTTLAARWDEGRKMIDAARKWYHQPDRGVTVIVQPDSPEPGLEPLQALADQMQSYSRYAKLSPEQIGVNNDMFRVHFGATYMLIPPANLLAAGILKPTPEDAARAREVVGRMEDVLRAWRERHPEYWDALGRQWRLHYGTRTASATPIWLYVSYRDKSAEPMHELLAQLAAIPGVPAPLVTVRDESEPPPPTGKSGGAQP